MSLNNNPWAIVIVGFLLVFTTILIYRSIYLYFQWKNSFHKKIYANFFEYLLRKKSLERMSTSFYLQSIFGDHRIIYQLVSHDANHQYQGYIIIILESGVYLYQVHNEIGMLSGDLNKKVVLERNLKGKIKRKAFTNLASKSLKVSEKMKMPGVNITPLYLFSDEAILLIKPVNDVNICFRRSDYIKDLENRFKEDIIKEKIDIEQVYSTLKEEVFNQC